jgi:hypothetical protein
LPSGWGLTALADVPTRGEPSETTEPLTATR